MNFIRIAFFFIAFIAIQINLQAQNNFKVVVEDVDVREGTVYAGICGAESNFPYGDAIQDVKVKVKKRGKVVLKFKNIPNGTYAIRIYQDLDGNQEMDMEGQRPIEPFGFSNTKALFGPPTFESCKFDVPAIGKSMSIRMLRM